MGRPNKLSPQDIDSAAVMYASGIVGLRVAQRFGVTYEAIKHQFKKRGIPIRGQVIKYTGEETHLLCYNCRQVKPTAAFVPSSACSRKFVHTCRTCTSKQRFMRLYKSETAYQRWLTVTHCECCNKPREVAVSEYKVSGLVQDHNHLTGALRGIICGMCNSAAGYALDNIDILNKAADYLQLSYSHGEVVSRNFTCAVPSQLAIEDAPALFIRGAEAKAFIKPCGLSRRAVLDYLRPYFHVRESNKSLMRLYGISADKYDSMLAAQGGKCAICSATSSIGMSNKLFMDHCHSKQTIRNLVCHRCNTLLGVVSDDGQTLKAVAAYLSNYLIDTTSPPTTVN